MGVSDDNTNINLARKSIMNSICYNVICQTIGLIGSVLMILSFQCKKPKKLIIMQSFGGLMFAVNFFMLGAYTGSILNGVNVIRGVAFTKIKKKTLLTPVTIILIYIIATALTYNGWLSLFVFIAQSAGTITFYINTDKAIKLGNLFITSPLWLIYNIVNGSIGGILCESFVITSIIIYIIRTKGFSNVGESENRP